MRTPVPFILLTLAALTGADEPREPVPRLVNLSELATADDYPSLAAAKGQEGTAIVEVHVDRDGLVTSCRVTSSSGHTALDEQSCALFRARARFRPARDARGRPVASVYRRPMTWRLEGDPPPPLPRQAWVMRQIISLDENGNPVGCRMEAVGAPAVAACSDVLGRKIPIPASEKPANAASEMIGETHFYPVEATKVTVAPGRADAIKLGQHVSEVVIGADGRVTECKSIRSSGAIYAEREVCELLDQCRFSTAEANSGALRGTMGLAAYARQRAGR